MWGAGEGEARAIAARARVLCSSPGRGYRCACFCAAAFILFRWRGGREVCETTALTRVGVEVAARSRTSCDRVAHTNA